MKVSKNNEVLAKGLRAAARAGRTALYGAVGLVALGSQAAPEVVRKGQEELDKRIAEARSIGKFVLEQGGSRLFGLLGFDFRSPRPQPPKPGPQGDQPGGSGAGADQGTPRGPAARASQGSAETKPDPSGLGIEDYDSLSASQVIRRLAGLSPAELAAVEAYERATRRRQTILARIAQLQGRPPGPEPSDKGQSDKGQGA